jgi:excinuclease ABC subunit C
VQQVRRCSWSGSAVVVAPWCVTRCSRGTVLPWHSGRVSAQARTAAGRLPASPGVYRFRDDADRILYIGRAASLRRRVASYWGDLGDRPHLTRMVARINRVEAVRCDSEHEAAWLERNLLERGLPRWNRTPGGQETEVCILLDSSARSPGLSVRHCAGRPAEARPGGPRPFGPYLGGGRVRLAVAGLLRVFPLGYASDLAAGTAADLAAQRGVSGADRQELAGRLAAILERDPATVTSARVLLTGRRDGAARAEAFELAARIQAELDALDWVTCPQRAASFADADADVAGWADGVLVRFEIRAGRLAGWRQSQQTRAAAQRWLERTPPGWRAWADRNAALAASLAAPRRQASESVAGSSRLAGSSSLAGPESLAGSESLAGYGSGPACEITP